MILPSSKRIREIRQRNSEGVGGEQPVEGDPGGSSALPEPGLQRLGIRGILGARDLPPAKERPSVPTAMAFSARAVGPYRRKKDVYDDYAHRY